jgi:cell wall-associated NlpC family hydrolase
VIPRSTYEQYLTAQINKASARLPGDLLFIAGSDPGAHGEPGHVMGYVAPGRVFEAACTACGPIGEVAFDTNSPLIEYVTRPALLLPPAPPTPPHPQPTENPTPAQLAASGHPPLVPMLNGDQSREAHANGWTLWYWTGFHFAPVVPTTRLHPGERQYARTGWQTPKAGR